jgi:TPR repeat protein
LNNGEGVKADTEAARKWFQKAAEAGQPEAVKWCLQNKISFKKQ